MEDRKKFETRELPNGVTVHSHAMDVPFFSIGIILPVGVAHSHTGNPGGVPGIAHFLEHALFHRSKLYPEKGSFEKKVALKGGYWNAFTGPFSTAFELDAPLDLQVEAVEGFFDHVFNPIILEEDLAIERGIVRNERDQRKYYPGADEVEEYLDTQWMHDRFYPKEQAFGSDADLGGMTADAVRLFHHQYSAKGIQIVVGGGHRLDPILDRAASIATTDVALTSSVEEAGWVRREYHEKSFRNIATPTYYLGSIVPRFDLFEEYTLQFILRLLTNEVHGPLYEWLRKEKGWTYGTHWGNSSSRDRMEMWLKIPVNDRAVVATIRNEIHERIRKALANAALVEREVSRREHNTLFFYQKLDDRLGEAANNLMKVGRIISEQEYREMSRRLNDTTLLLDLYEKYLSPSVSGEVLLLPE